MAIKVVCAVLFVCVAVSVEAAPVESDPDFVVKQGKALKYTKVVPGTKRDEVDLAKAEKDAGKAVLKLLDAKIGSKVQQAASEVTDFLNGAIGKHAKARSDKLRTDKEKEISLIHLGAQKAIKQKDKVKKKKKDDSFLIHFKVPYVVTKVKSKGKKKYHHHHHHHRHDPQHNPGPYHPYKPPPNPPAHRPVVHRAPNTYGQQPQQGIAGQPPFNAINLNYNPNGWSYSLSNGSSAGMAPCQGSCTDPCTPQCALNQGCCCCPAEVIEQPPQYLHVPAVTPPPAAPVPAAAAGAPASPAAPCPPACSSNCYSYCPQSCCGMMGKRTEVPSEDGSATEDAESAEETDDTETDDAGDAQGQKDDAKPEQDDDKEDEKSAADESGKDEAGDESENRNESKESPDDV